MNDLKEQLKRLRNQVLVGAIGASPDWGGADVVIGPPPRPVPTVDGFYPDPDYVATKHHRELSWLFEQLRDLFAPYIDYMNKYEFYGRLADSANRFISTSGDEVQQDVLQSVLHEANSLLVEFSTFGDLQPSISRKIGDDPLENMLNNDMQDLEGSKRTLRELGLES